MRSEMISEMGSEMGGKERSGPEEEEHRKVEVSSEGGNGIEEG